MTAGRLKALLAISVVVNLFALGALGGGAAMWMAASERHPIRSASDALPNADRRRFHQMFRAVAQQVRPLQQSARENRRAAALLFVEPTFDAAAAGEALSRARDADLAARTEVETALVGFAATLPQTERQAFADGLSQSGGPLRQPKRVAAGRQN
jgi:uncharacterized membrane protein